MRAWIVDHPGPMATGPLRLVERPDPVPGEGEVLVRVSTCGVCRTDLHLAEGDLAPKRHGVIPGHEVVGTVIGHGPGAPTHAIGRRVGVPWLRRTCGRCRFCRRDQENLCVAPEFTGWDADGGYAELLVAPEAFVLPLPEGFDDRTAAPLLCAGIIGYRALTLADLPPDGRLGIYGFGGSAHLTAQVARHHGIEVHVLTRSADARRLALELGATSAGGAFDSPPAPLDAAIVFAPVGELVPPALRALDRGGSVVVAGIHLTDIPPLTYATDLFEERVLRSVTANTRQDAMAFLQVAADIPIRPTVQAYPFEAADRALADLAADRVDGAAVLVIGADAGGTR